MNKTACQIKDTGSGSMKWRGEMGHFSQAPLYRWAGYLHYLNRTLKRKFTLYELF